MTDNVFLKAYFAMAIEAKELQHEVKGFLKNPSSTYANILENIHANYRYHTTSEHMRDTTTSWLGNSTILRGRSDRDVDKTKVTGGGNVKVWSENHVPRFPNNTGQLLPSEYYLQFCNWYTRMVKQPHNMSPDDVAWISNFNFEFQRKLYNQSKKTGGNNGYHDDYHSSSGGYKGSQGNYDPQRGGSQGNYNSQRGSSSWKDGVHGRTASPGRTATADSPVVQILTIRKILLTPLPLICPIMIYFRNIRGGR